MTFLRDDMVREEMHPDFYDAAYNSACTFYEIDIWFFGA